jgi:hypothetical protein
MAKQSGKHDWILEQGSFSDCVRTRNFRNVLCLPFEFRTMCCTKAEFSRSHFSPRFSGIPLLPIPGPRRNILTCFLGTVGVRCRHRAGLQQTPTHKLLSA